MSIQNEEQVEVQNNDKIKKVYQITGHANCNNPLIMIDGGLVEAFTEEEARETYEENNYALEEAMNIGIDFYWDEIEVDFVEVAPVKTKQKFRIRAEAYAGSFIFGEDETYLVEAFDEDEAKEIFEEDNDATQFVEDSLYNVYWDDIDAIPVQDDGQDIELQEAS